MVCSLDEVDEVKEKGQGGSDGPRRVTSTNSENAATSSSNELRVHARARSRHHSTTLRFADGE